MHLQLRYRSGRQPPYCVLDFNGGAFNFVTIFYLPRQPLHRELPLTKLFQAFFVGINNPAKSKTNIMLSVEISDIATILLIIVTLQTPLVYFVFGNFNSLLTAYEATSSLVADHK